MPFLMKRLFFSIISVLLLSSCSLSNDVRHDVSIVKELTSSVEKATQDNVISHSEANKIAQLMLRHHLLVEKYDNDEERQLQFLRQRQQLININLQDRYANAMISIPFFEGGEELMSLYQKLLDCK